MEKVKLALDLEVEINDIRKVFVLLDLGLPTDDEIKEGLCDPKNTTKINFKEMLGEEATQMTMALIGFAIAIQSEKIEKSAEGEMLSNWQRRLKEMMNRHGK